MATAVGNDATPWTVLQDFRSNPLKNFHDTWHVDCTQLQIAAAVPGRAGVDLRASAGAEVPRDDPREPRLLPSSAQVGSVLGSWGKTTRGAVRNKQSLKRRRTPTQDPSTYHSSSSNPSAFSTSTALATVPMCAWHTAASGRKGGRWRGLAAWNLQAPTSFVVVLLISVLCSYEFFLS